MLVADFADPSETRQPFRDAEPWLASFDNSLLGMLLTSVGDIVLLIDRDGRLKDVAGTPGSNPGLDKLIGEAWIDTVTVESRPKVQEMLSGETPARWRQVNQLIGGSELPVRYLTFPLNGTGRWVAIGRDERANATMQQRLAAGAAVARARLSVAAPGRIPLPPAVRHDCGADDHRRGGNSPDPRDQSGRSRAVRHRRRTRPAADRRGSRWRTGAVGRVPGRRLPRRQYPAADRADARRRRSRNLGPCLRQSGANYLLLRLAGGESTGRAEPGLVDIIDRMPDAFVLTDAKLQIVTANASFVDAVHAVSLERLRGRSLEDF
jgi:PAS domain-containing protein